ncbi:hypothetical protein DDE18_17285 [Nocardioides gansuensis]|uniref:HTH luxR-type domain-containing protein n=1 Tax=Nocardioides gansuensis TaxID=2138300 RepID=A0A2T8F7N4_9ACTN|nr:response regulator transcription factor [Nocardioides gansuensis]PVG81728.1 hypothetical protein DDE18_17285 [Nocardioides gansuensis]
MMTKPTPRAHPAASHGVGRILVLSRLPLVAQAVAAALASRGRDVVALVWAGDDAAASTRMVRQAAEDDLMIVLDELEDESAVEQILSLVSGTRARCMVITTHPPDRAWGALLDHGVAAILPGESSLEKVEEVIALAGRGADMMQPEVREHALQEHTSWTDERSDIEARFARLSPRELQVLELLAAGHRVREVSEIVGRTEGTVRSQIKSVRHKLGVHSQLAAVVIAHRMGLGDGPR